MKRNILSWLLILTLLASVMLTLPVAAAEDDVITLTIWDWDEAHMTPHDRNVQRTVP